MSSFAQLKASLREWPSLQIGTNEFPEDVLERLREVLLNLQLKRERCGPSDLASLVRHALRREAARFQGHPRLLVPTCSPWPDRACWEKHGCTVSVGKSSKCLEIEAQSWEPNWLQPLRRQTPITWPPLHAVESEEQRRQETKIPADPAFRERFGHEYYASIDQSEAVRGVLLSRPGSVLLAVLPTGAGKSIVGLSAALLGTAEAGGVSVFVVPTISLAYDQVEQARHLCPATQIDAWHSGLVEAERREIRNRLRSGTQRVLFVSPESLVTALAKDLFEVAGQGILRAFVVDEAHLIAFWGTSFRPEFQTMGALWRELRARCPAGMTFRTLLMTATLTEDAFHSIARFFGPVQEIETLAAVRLRPEPDYYQFAVSGACEPENGF